MGYKKINIPYFFSGCGIFFTKHKRFIKDQYSLSQSTSEGRKKILIFILTMILKLFILSCILILNFKINFKGEYHE